MKNIIKRQIITLSKQKNIKKYSITHDGLCLILKLKPRAQQLLLDILSKMETANSIESLTVSLNYHDLGFDSCSNFRRYRNDLIQCRLIFYKDNLYYINPCYINRHTRRLQEYLFRKFNLIKSKPVVMTDPALMFIAK